MRHWILDENRRAVPVDMMTWARWMNSAERIVKQETIGDYWISTVFLGLDHNYAEEGPPILWETMVFRKLDPPKTIVIQGKTFTHDSESVEQERCAGNWEQAEAMHSAMVERVQAILHLNVT